MMAVLSYYKYDLGWRIGTLVTSYLCDEFNAKNSIESEAIVLVHGYFRQSDDNTFIRWVKEDTD